MPSQQTVSCAYCGISTGNGNCLVYCDTVDAWFCNGTRKSLPARSHAVEHFRQARSAQLCVIHPCRTGQFESLKIVCAKCGNCNVFDLGIHQLLTNPSGGLNRFLCRLTCVEKGSNWEPVIVDGKFHRLIAKTVELSGEMDVSTAIMQEKERAWQPVDNENGEKKGEDLAAFEKKIDLPEKKPSSFENCGHYVRVGQNFLRLEQKACEVEMKKREKEGNVTVRWLPIGGRDDEIRVGFKLRQMTRGHRLNPGNPITISLRNTWQSLAIVNSVRNEVTAVLKRTSTTPVGVTQGFTIAWSVNIVPYERMFKALNNFGRKGGPVVQAILGHKQGARFPLNFAASKAQFAPGLPRLNESQENAVRYALKRAVAVIEAPPGTGKTTVAAVMAYHLICSVQTGPVLLCAPSNIAADNLASALAQTGLDGVIRMYARWREADQNYTPADEAVNKLALHRIVQPLVTGKRKLRVLEGEFLDKASVIVCTCIAAGDPRLEKIPFEALIIDECSQASENECLVPIERGKIERVILIGDRKQLGPIVQSKKARRAAFSVSLFERLGRVHGSVSLQIQYRMHPAISAFPSECFYENKVRDGISARERTLFIDEDAYIWPKPGFPVVFLQSSFGNLKMASSKREEMSSSATSFLNRHECELVHEILCRLFELDVDPSQIGVITMYEGQREYLSAYLSTLEPEHCGHESASSGVGDNNWVSECGRVEIATVDGYQGRENDFIVISCVRSNARKCVGFLADSRRINVALTRARYGLIIVGDSKTLETCPTWQRLIKQYRKQGTLISCLPGFDEQ